MKIKTAALALALLATTPVMAQDAGMMGPVSASQFRAQAMMTDTFEIRAAQLALERSRNAAVRRYAQSMVNEHTAVTQALMSGGQGGMAMSSPGSTAAAGAAAGGAAAGPVGAAVGAGAGLAAGIATAPLQVITGGAMEARPGVSVNAQQAEMLEQLSAARGRAFDRLYVESQIMGHQQAIALYTSFIQSGRDRPLADWATQVLPHLQQHLARAERLDRMVR